VKNFLTVTLLSVGMPMPLMGDEMRRIEAVPRWTKVRLFRCSRTGEVAAAGGWVA